MHRFLDLAWQWFPAYRVVSWLRFVMWCVSLLTAMVLASLKFAKPKEEVTQPNLVIAVAKAMVGVDDTKTSPTANATSWNPINTLGESLASKVAGNEFEWAMWLTAIQLIAGTGVAGLRHMGVRNGEKKEQIQLALNHFLARIAPDELLQGHTYRLTLFRVRRVKMFGLWLGICGRSGETHQRWRTVFSLDPEDAAKCQGFAGECWFFGAHTKSYSSVVRRIRNVDRNDLDAYAEECGLTVETASRLKQRCTDFMLCPLVKSGKVWGILVFDTTDEAWASTKPKEALAKSAIDDASASIGFLIG